MTTVFGLLLCCFAMFTGSFFAGNVPLTFALSERRLRLVSAFGTGLLLGTVFVVILPEGLSTLLQGGGSKKWIGGALVAGFAMMFLLEQFSAPFPHHSHISITELQNTLPNQLARKSYSLASIGLIIHAGADGMALGAAFATDQTEMEVVIFLSVFLHKAPAAFGLTAQLLREGQTRLAIQRTLGMFSIAAPFTSMLTYVLLWLIGNGGGTEAEQRARWKQASGVLLLFSGGTFLYVAAVHALRELVGSHGAYQHIGTGKARLDGWQTAWLMVGMLGPLML